MTTRFNGTSTFFSFLAIYLLYFDTVTSGCGTFSSPARQKRYRVTTLFESPLPVNQKAQIENLLGALKTKPIETSSPERTIHVVENSYPNPKMADCTIEIQGPSFGTSEMLHIQEVVRSQVNILVRPNTVRSVQVTSV